MTNHSVKNKALKTRKGIVGFFDILGYQSFLLNNAAEDAAKDAAEEVLTILDNIDLKLVNAFVRDIPDAEEAFLSFFKEEFGLLVFSDTILLTSEYKVDCKQRLDQWLLFFTLSSLLCEKMFEFGLPIRGAISFGDYITKNNCFAGKPIVEAYKVTEDLNLAACVLADSAKNEFESLSPFSETNKYSRAFKLLTLKYLVPFKNKKEESSFVLKYDLNTNKQDDDIRQIILNSFWRHNKDISLSAHEKVNNTEKFIRFLKFKNKKNNG